MAFKEYQDAYEFEPILNKKTKQVQNTKNVTVTANTRRHNQSKLIRSIFKKELGVRVTQDELYNMFHDEMTNLILGDDLEDSEALELLKTMYLGLLEYKINSKEV